MHATRAAVEAGILPGGGVALLRASEVLKNLRTQNDDQTGVDIVRKALSAPARQIATNAGEDGSVIVGKILACGYALANKGHDTRALQAYLGHRNIQHTVRYTELSPTRFKDFWRD